MKNTPSLNRTNAQKAEMQLFFPSWARVEGGAGRGRGDPHGTAERILLRLRIPTWIWVPPLLCLWANPLTSLSAGVPGTLFRNVTSQNSHKCIFVLTVLVAFCSRQRCKGQEMGGISLVKENPSRCDISLNNQKHQENFQVGVGICKHTQLHSYLLLGSLARWAKPWRQQPLVDLDKWL